MPGTKRSQAGTTSDEDSYKTDASLSDQGRLYAEKMGQALLQHRDGERLAMISRGGPDIPLKPLRVWTSTRRRTAETAEWLDDQGYSVRQRTQLSQLNPGVCEKMSERRIRAEMPEEVAKHEADPYHHRYPRAEARLSFPRNEIIEIIPASYNNESSSIPIPDLPPEIIPSSPEDLKIPVPPSEVPSGTATPINLDSPRTAPGSPRFSAARKTVTPPVNGGSTPQEPGEGSLLLVERALRD
ncbi:MAG: hypothetical protein Q9166_001378 [cf. Caloplaca sp. 2 TL-2023]